MAYSTLMVILDWRMSNNVQLAAAGDLAECFNSNVIGLVPADENTRIGAGGVIYSQEATEHERAAFKRSLAACEAEFEDSLKGRSKKVEFRTAAVHSFEEIAHLTRIADLTVTIGADTAHIRELPMLNNIVLRSGRPVMVVPPSRTLPLNQLRTLIAWKDSIEARRAISFALPLLQTSDSVVVAGIPEGKTDRHATLASVSDITGWLQRHGIASSTIVPDAAGNASERLRTIGEQNSANIIVAGAYGRSPTREWIMGGVTRTLLAPTSRCSFLVH